MSDTSRVPTFDAVVVGGGHNGLTAAAYLARAGLSVTVLERLDSTGGAAVSKLAFKGHDARLSRYSYLVSLMPRAVIEDLGLDVKLARRRYASYTPVPGDPEGRGLLVDNGDPDATRKSFEQIGAPADAAAFADLNDDLLRVAQALWPTVTEPLPTRSSVRARIGDDALWEALFERPIAEFIESKLSSDLVRGVVATDALIGTFSDPSDTSLRQNRCFLYHVIGGGTGDWDVPAGGMGHVTRQLADAALNAGAEILTGAEVISIDPDGTVTFIVDGEERTAVGNYVLSGVAPYVLDRLLGKPEDRSARPEGAQVKVNLLLKRLPKLRDSSIAPEAAFGGTFHINETYSQLKRAYDDAVGGEVPSLLPCEVYCHSLTDPSILGSDLISEGVHTLTVFGLHVPDRLLTAENNDAMRSHLQQAVIASLNSVLAEPIEDVLMVDADGNPCIETKTTLDIEDAIAMPGGNIFHGPLSWPFAEDDADLSTPAKRWGVSTEHERILLCGSGAKRGGGVSGIGGHNAAMAVLEAQRQTAADR
ncbi:NAD(P)/FAD-dependent oxidoreductase [Sinomonas sp. ASV322]|uniref:phytoene desaturase family protein n=1 Tax=Sinomonas sp. ASV322 TaxID=3041920 RepID=UPI0027DC52D4|nr:NAD(P)/FAD-dependent oxidoreductase [Sinomonas sp. ASV322]MDQ4501068.1 NAD(P)/FAD-dependent oxidoreductase [Sinomonas sp. ASV322]